MVQCSPDTDSFFAYGGYLYGDEAIRGFSHVHLEGIGIPAGGNVPFMPTVGPVESTDAMRYQSRFSHSEEEASPGYYRVTLQSYGIQAELTAGLRTGMHRYTFPAVSRANLLIDVGRQIPGGGPFPPIPRDSASIRRIPGRYSASAEIRPEERMVVGTANPGLDGPLPYAVHFAARFSRPFHGFAVWEGRGDPARPGVDHVEGNGAGVVVTFDAGKDRQVVVKVGISFVSRANALANLDAEVPEEDFDFDAQRSRTRAAWNDTLGAMEVGGGTEGETRSFYTALYHAQQHPNVFSDANGEYLGHDGQVHRIGVPGDPMPAGSTYYANFSLWDTYRGQSQLLALVAPGRFGDMMRSLAAIRKWGGRLPRWSLMNGYPDWMPGEPVLQTVADAHCRGLIPDDAVEDLYEGARDLALADHRDPIYLARGWVPHDVDPGGASATLEHALGDFALALMADRLGRHEDRDRLLALAGNWVNVFDEDSRFMRPRMGDGSWLWAGNFPGVPEGFVEGTGWQYTWLVPHDVGGLFDRMGAPPRAGDEFVIERLDTFFSAALGSIVAGLPDEARERFKLGVAHAGNQYEPSNEHDMHAPYLYNWAGQPWKTQALMRACRRAFNPTPDGIPGNDDLGAMSAWYVWSALGFYPAIPGAPVYVIGSPVFEKAVIHLPEGRTFVVSAPGVTAEKAYIQSARLGDRDLARTWLTHAELLTSGRLDLDLARVPSLDWGAERDSAPPSMSANPLSGFHGHGDNPGNRDRDALAAAFSARLVPPSVSTTPGEKRVAVRYLSDEYADEVTRRLRSNEVVLKAAEGKTVRVQHIVTDGPGGDEIEYYFQVIDGIPQVGMGKIENPDVSVTRSYETAIAVDRGQMNSLNALVQGKVRMTGDIIKMMLLESLLAAVDQAAGEIERAC